MYDDVLVATDGSDVADAATEQGIALARGPEATVHVLSVAPDEESRTLYEEFAAAVADDAREAGRVARSTVREGRPAGEILAYADEHDVDLIVVGTHGRTGIQQVLVGSVALEVVRDARRPVCTVSPNATIAETVDDVALATDGWSGSAAATDHALGLAGGADARLHALYAVDVESDVSDTLAAFEEHGAQTTMDVVDQAASRDIEATRRVEQGPPHETILAYVDEEDVDVLVMGTESKSTLERLVVGSVSQRVVPNATVPVVTVRTIEDE